MICDHCGAEESVVHLTQIVDNEMRTVHLCPACAEEQGVEGMPLTGGAFPLADFLSQMAPELAASEMSLQGDQEGPSGEGLDTPVSTSIRSCPFCRLTLGEFRKSGRLGCPECWAAFEPHMRGLLRRIHGSHQHVGKVYLSPDPSTSEKRKRISALRRKLQRAVDLEDFERAAELRDEIHTLDRSDPGEPE